MLVEGVTGRRELTPPHKEIRRQEERSERVKNKYTTIINRD